MRKAALGWKHKDEIKKLMSENRKKENNPFYGKIHTLKNLNFIKSAAKNNKSAIFSTRSYEVEITELETKFTTVYF